MTTKERATRLEGSFVIEKEHFLQKKKLARTKKIETLIIFFGIHTSNALQVVRRIGERLQIAA